MIAVAGSGKSTAMVARIKHLIQQGVIPNRIWALMFNSAARDSFKQKLKKEYSNRKDWELPQVLTFHGCGTQLIKRLAPKYLPDNYKLEASSGKLRSATRKILEPFLKGDHKKVAAHLDDFLSFVDLVKSTTDTAKDVFIAMNLPPARAWFIEAYERFEIQRHQDKVRYFSDLIYDPMMALIKHPDAQLLVAGMMDYLIVDEYQDINEIQQQMIKILAGDKAQVMGVGDPDQCIYAWRGARPDFILRRFHDDFPNPTQYQLTRTFRYGHALSVAANHVISNNVDRIDQLCISGEGVGSTELSLQIESLRSPTIPGILDKWVEEGHRRADVAILVRNFSHAIPVELALLNMGTPYQMEGGEPVFLKAEMAAILCALKIAAGTLFQKPQIDGRLVSNFLQVPPLMLGYEDERDLIYTKMANDPENAVHKLSDLKFRVSQSWQRKRIEAKANLWRNLASLGEDRASELIQYFFDAGELDHFFRQSCKSDEQYDDKLMLFDTFARYAEIKENQGMSLREFVDHIDELIKTSSSMKDREDPVLITSCHRSKGLEWDMVILAGLSDGRFPFIPQRQDTPVSIEDERRLFYVAMTRARKRLCLVIPNDPDLMRWLGNVNRGAPEGIESSRETASRFIYESNLFLAQLADQIVGAGRLPAKLIGLEGSSLMQAYLEQLQEPNEGPVEELAD